MHKKKQPSETQTELMDQRMDMKKIMKDIQLIGSSRMTWKERKELENRKVVSLGGKPPQKQRLPLSVARPAMKNQKKRDQKLLEERLILGRFGATLVGDTKKVVEKRKPEDRVLKSSVGNFRNGVLDVKHMLKPTSSRDNDSGTYAIKGKKKKGSGKNGRGKSKGGGRKRR